MTILVIGTRNSGKSVYAEHLAEETGDESRYYLATMKICDDAGVSRVQKHRKLRDGKGFVTIEKEYDILTVLEQIQKPEEATVLLECAANLVGNEMHDNPLRKITTDSVNEERERFVGAVSGDIRILAEHVHNLIIVTNEYPASFTYDAETELYVSLLHEVNERLRAFCGHIVDCRVDA